MSRSQGEFRLACVVSDYLARFVPTLEVTHVPLGENRDPITGARLKRMGARRGWPDYVAPIPPTGRLLALELKAEGGRQSPEQKAVQGRLEAAGARYVIIRSLDDLRQTLAEEGIPTREDRQAAVAHLISSTAAALTDEARLADVVARRRVSR